MLKLPLYSRQEMITAFEFGLILSQVAKDMNVTLNPDIVTEAEKNLIAELRQYGYKKTNLHFIPLVLASLPK